MAIIRYVATAIHQIEGSGFEDKAVEPAHVVQPRPEFMAGNSGKCRRGVQIRHTLFCP
jgi:hypothetical protein